jgi:benzylsuccinate CoA-transferase BbsF subunit
MSEQALKGVKILDFSRVIAGPLMTKYLAEHGATVVRVESRNFQDQLRISSPYAGMKPGTNRSGYFAMWNPNKYSISLNLRKPGGLDIIKRLAKWCDVVVENFAPGVMDRMGLGYEQLKEINSSIIMVSSSNQGQTGPSSKFAGLGYTLTALSGYTALTSDKDRGTTTPFNGLTDLIAPAFGATALMAALEYRERTGKGQYLDLSQYECSLYLLSPVLLDYMMTGKELRGLGNRHANAVPHGAYPCKGLDSWCVIAVETEEEWRAFCNVVAQSELLRDELFGSLEKRKENEDQLDEIISEWTKNRTPVEVMTVLQEAGIASGAVQSPADLFDDPQLKHRNHFACLDHPEIGQMSYETSPFQLTLTPGKLDRPAPCLGQDNEIVCKQFLNMEEDEINMHIINGDLE